MIQSLTDAIAFIKRFHRRFPAAPELDPARVPEALPHPLSILYRELGGWLDDVETPGPLSTQNYLYGVDALHWPEPGIVEFASENQGNWTCRCAVDVDDPPVLSDATDYWDDPIEGFNQVSPRLSDFLITFMLTEAVFACPDMESDVDVDPADDTLVPLWLGGRQAYEHTFDFYTSPEQDVLYMRSDGEWYVGRPL